MNLIVIRAKNETEDFLLSITTNCEALIVQTHRKAEKALQFKMTKPAENFHFNLPNQIKGDWIIGLIKLESYNSFF